MHNLGTVEFGQDCGEGLFSSLKWEVARNFRAHALVVMSNHLTLLHNIVICKVHNQTPYIQLPEKLQRELMKF